MPAPDGAIEILAFLNWHGPRGCAHDREAIVSGLVTLLDVEHFLFLFAGTMLGLLIGILPGLGGIAGLSLLLPFVYGKDPTLVLSMMVGLLAMIGAFGFVLRAFVYVAAFLRAKAGSTWAHAVLGGLGAAALFALLSHFLVLDYPKGILQSLIDMPWPLN